MYYNTNNETQPQLFRSWAQTAKQNDLIYEVFKRHTHREFTPDDIHNHPDVSRRRWPITSIRRAISNLTNKYDLVKTDIMRVGLYGKQEHCWKLARDDGQLKLL